MMMTSTFLWRDVMPGKSYAWHTCANRSSSCARKARRARERRAAWTAHAPGGRRLGAGARTLRICRLSDERPPPTAVKMPPAAPPPRRLGRGGICGARAACPHTLEAHFVARDGVHHLLGHLVHVAGAAGQAADRERLILDGRAWRQGSRAARLSAGGAACRASQRAPALRPATPPPTRAGARVAGGNGSRRQAPERVP